jgi:hypothetical protein
LDLGLGLGLEAAHALGGELGIGGRVGERDERLDAVALDEQPLVVRRYAKVGHGASGEPLHLVRGRGRGRGKGRAGMGWLDIGEG